MSNLYEQDFYQWTIEQAALLREGKIAEADIENLVDEIAGVGNGLLNELCNSLAEMMRHMLVWQYRPEARTEDSLSVWRMPRTNIEALLHQSPSLREYVFQEDVQESYELAQTFAAGDMGVDESTFPKTCPWTFEEIMALDIKT